MDLREKSIKEVDQLLEKALPDIEGKSIKEIEHSLAKALSGYGLVDPTLELTICFGRGHTNCHKLQIRLVKVADK